MQELLKTKRAWRRGLPMKITELMDGENFKVSIVRDGADWKYDTDHPQFLDDRMMGLLNTLCEDHETVTLHCVAIGSDHAKVNDYGAESTILLTDVEFPDKFMDDDVFVTYAEMFQFQTPPVYIRGRFAPCLLQQFKAGATVYAPATMIKSPFKERIGIVITPLEETHSAFLEGRLIGKVYNPKYEALIQ